MNEASKAWQKQKRKDDPAWREMTAKKARAFQQTQAFKKRRSHRQRERYTSDLEFRTACQEAKRARRLRPGHAEAERAKNLARFVKKYRNDPEFKKQVNRKSSERAKRPEVREMLNDRVRARYQSDIIYREQVLEKLRVYRGKARIKRQRLAAHRKRLKTQKGREVARAASRNYRARKKASEGFHTADDVTAILHKQNFQCNYCKSDISTSRHIDHIKPLVLGGTNWPENLQALCVSCNCRKQGVDAVEFEKRLGEVGDDVGKVLADHIVAGVV